MALNNIGLGIVFTASDLASNVIQGLARNFMGLGNQSTALADTMAKKLGVSTDVLTASMHGLTKGLTLAAAGAVGLMGAFSLAEAAGEFEFKLAGIKAILGATTAEMKALENSAIDAGIATQFSPLEAAEGLQILAQAGFDAKKSIEILNPVLDLAAASLGQLSLEQAGGLAVASIKVFGDEIKNTRDGMDILVRSTTRSSLQFRELPLALGIAARGAKAFSASMEDTLIALGEVRNVIPTVERGATAVAVTMERLAAPTTRGKKALKDLGIEVANADGSFRPFLDVISEVSHAFAGLSEQQRAANIDMIFGKRAGAGVVVLLEQISKKAEAAGGGTEGYALAIKKMRLEMQKASITAASFRDALLDTFKGQKILLRGTMETIAISIGKPFAQVFKPIVKGVVNILNFFLRLFTSMPDAAKKAAAGLFVFLSAATMIFGAVTALVAMKGILATILAAAGLVILPFIKIVAVIALVIGALLLLKAAWDANVGGIRDALLPVLESVWMVFRGLIQLITSGKITGALAEALAKPENSGLLDFIEGFTRVFFVLKAVFMGVFGALRDSFMRVMNTSRGSFFAIQKAVFGLGNLFVKLGKIVGISLGFKQSESGIDSIEKFVYVLTTALVAIVEGPLHALIITFEVFMAFLNATIDIANAIAAPFVGLARIIGGAFEIVFGLLTFNLGMIFEGVTSIVNAMIGMINIMIEAARDVAAIIGANDLARKLDGYRIEKLTASQTALVFGADETAKELADTASNSAAQERAANFIPESGGAMSIPDSVPATARATNQGGLSGTDVARIIEAAMEGGAMSQRGDIMIRSTVDVDGQVLAESQSKVQRDRASRRGRLAPSLRNE